ncbi:transcriptional repressor NF-X1-like isoform X1 [Clavelina lepadiformis]|uniref:transcriptional repressor NF-X1-like isoform X1 n=1 Tax=Clavelina lepadiformis TaxID=159417 RepID=UPI0040438340
MSLRPSFYGGFPGPPEQQQQNEPFQRNQGQERVYPSQAFRPPRQDVAYFSDPSGPGFNSSLAAPHFNGNRFLSPDLYYTQYNYYPNHPEYAFAAGYHPGQQIEQYSVTMAQSPVDPSGSYYVNETNLPASVNSRDNYANKPTSDATAPTMSAGKSRRFSRQRNIKEASSPGTSGEICSQNLEKESNQHTSKQNKKAPIRFSHQRQNDTNVTAVSEKKSESHQKRKSEKENRGTKETGKSASKAKDTNSNKGNVSKPKKNSSNMRFPADERNQASVLLDQLSDGTYECMVCCDRVRQQHAVWNCTKCYNLFHMGCIKKWARSPAAKVEESGWRCPGCQNVTKNVPTSYYCFCGKVREPEWNRGEIPHSCGDACGRARRDNPDCTHPCNILCHPGPCPQCPAMVNKRCRCGRSSSRVRCSRQSGYMCNEPCRKLKNCRLHSCDVICHSGLCQDCDVTVVQECFCGKHTRDVKCGSTEHRAVSPNKMSKGCYSCAEVCGKALSCGNHTCEESCHAGPCASCPLQPSAVTLCPCTQTKLSEIKHEDGSPVIREKCTDPIPTCGKVCQKPLECGGEEIHVCKMLCHTGKCLPCPDGESTVTCRCRKSEKDVDCADYMKMKGYICDRRCNKKRKCGRHKCGQTCCLDNEHACSQICGRKLTCGIHRCDDLCHRGACHTCYNVSFDELRCYCGEQVIFPPIPCGTRPPECSNECTRMHACTHPIRHTCHTDENCPPCVELVKKKCNCGRVMRGNIMCHIDNVSCGAPCRKVLPCGHKCLKPCHKEACTNPAEPCKQPCSIMRVECIHPCANSCHHGESCPVTPCKAMVTLRCPCGHREEQVVCFDGGAAIQSVNSAVCAAKESIDIGKLLRPGGATVRTLHCNEECALIERNRRFAEALQLKDVDYASETKQQYSDFLMHVAKTESAFIRTVERDLINLVESVQWLSSSKQSHPFPIMKREKRQVVHELAEAFKCKSESQDDEPSRNVVVTATKGVSKQPSPLLSDVVLEKSTVERSFSPARPTGRLLSSMKLVSYSSVETSSGNPETNKILPLARNIPSSTSRSVYKQPQSGSRDPEQRPSQHRYEAPTASSGARESTSRYIPPQSRGTGPTTSAPTSRKVAQEKPKLCKSEESHIDYFDMTD